jgi:hypothetical protein
VDLAAESPNHSSFETHLKNAMSIESDLTLAGIGSLGTAINENKRYGRECLQKLDRLVPNAKRMNSEMRETLAKNMIKDDLNKQRQRWAFEWFYYGNDPQNVSSLTDAIELEIWAFWILNEGFKVKEYTMRHRIDGPYSVYRVEGATFGDRGVPEPVLQKLADFDVLLGRTQGQITDQLSRLRSERESKEPEKERPWIDVGRKVDTEQEIKELESWAKKHRPQLSAGRMLYNPRALPSIETIHALGG